MAEDATDLEAQVGLALAALGLAFARTLAQREVPIDPLGHLRQEAEKAYYLLVDTDQHRAASMFGVFVRALNDKKLFPRPD